MHVQNVLCVLLIWHCNSKRQEQLKDPHGTEILSYIHTSTIQLLKKKKRRALSRYTKISKIKYTFVYIYKQENWKDKQDTKRRCGRKNKKQTSVCVSLYKFLSS